MFFENSRSFLAALSIISILSPTLAVAGLGNEKNEEMSPRIVRPVPAVEDLDDEERVVVMPADVVEDDEDDVSYFSYVEPVLDGAMSIACPPYLLFSAPKYVLRVGKYLGFWQKADLSSQESADAFLALACPYTLIASVPKYIYRSGAHERVLPQAVIDCMHAADQGVDI